MNNVIFHIARLADWQNAVDSGIYVCDSLEIEGFIHCSTSSQVIDVANRLFRGSADLILLSIHVPDLRAPLLYETAEGGSQSFPHIYGPLELETVIKAVTFSPNEDGSFSLPAAWQEIPYWQSIPLEAMNEHQWEALCDGCARCCLYKIQDIDTEELFYTNIACRFLDPETCRCKDYLHRHEIMPTCIILTPKSLQEIDWMPKTCAYRLLKENRPLRWWHPLVSGDEGSVVASGYSIAGQYLPEEAANMKKLENYIFEWFDILDDEEPER